MTSLIPGKGSEQASHEWTPDNELPTCQETLMVFFSHNRDAVINYLG